MEIYNIQDVNSLEGVYLKLRPYIKSHPNISLYDDVDKPRCCACGNTNLKEDGFYYTSTGKYQNYRCNCGALSRGRKSVLSKNKSINTLISVGK